ncbi:uncharacterized protein LOC119169119 isoform X1 [Rhipicephalus microplus]|uniref:uncharacterized protein LOC119169119 isoform X1 n=1 Tax=Rhipicephalus microplus TaxID=6941 RepID=UPI003F6D390D
MFGMSTATSQQKRLTRDHRLGQAMQRNRNVPLIRLRRLVSTPAAMMMLQQPPQESSHHQNGHARQDDNGPARALVHTAKILTARALPRPKFLVPKLSRYLCIPRNAGCVFFGPKDEPAHGGGWHVGNVDPRPSIALLAPAMQGINKRRRRVTLSPSFLQRTLRINAFV